MVVQSRPLKIFLYAKNKGTHSDKINIFYFPIGIEKVKLMTLLL